MPRSGGDCLPGFSPVQSRIITSPESRKQIVAAAGSGKTRTVVGLTRWRFEQGLERPGRFLLLSFSRKACAELRERLPESLKAAVEIRTFHGFCYRRLQEMHPILSRKPIQILEEKDRERFLSDRLRAHREEIGGIPFALLHRNRKLFYQYFPELAMQTFRALHAYKRERDLLEYDDLIGFLLRDMKNTEPWTESLRRSYDMILVDEFQDTDPSQLQFLRRMDPERLMVVGDDWQAIYSFRGATVHPFLDFRKLFRGTRVFRLAENYRSLHNIVRAGSRLIRRSSQQISKQVRSARGRGPGYPTVALALRDGEDRTLAGKLSAFDGYMILTRSNFRRAVWISYGIPAERVSTIHRAKGLEFPVVLMDVIGGWSGEEFLTDEEIRIAYVGLTRAQNLFCCLHRERYPDRALERAAWQELFLPVTRPVSMGRFFELMEEEREYRAVTISALPVSRLSSPEQSSQWNEQQEYQDPDEAA